MSKGYATSILFAAILLLAPATWMAGCTRQASNLEPSTGTPDIGTAAFNVPFPADTNSSAGIGRPRSGSALDEQQVLGDEDYSHAANAVEDTLAHTMQLLAGGNETSWAIYRFEGYVAGDTLQSVTLEFAATPDCCYVGFADFARGTWRWVELASPASSEQVTPPVLGDPISGGAAMYIAVLTWNYEVATLAGLSLTVDLTDGPVAVLKADRTQGQAPMNVEYDPDDSFDRGGAELVLFEWDWDNNGDWGISFSTDRTYFDEGVHTVGMRVTNELAQTAATSLDVEVYGWCHTMLVDYHSGCQGLALDGAENLYTFSRDEGNTLIYKFNKDGEYQWCKTWNAGRDYSVDVIAADNDGNVYLAGDIDNPDFGNANDVLLVKLNTNGEFTWLRGWHLTEYDAINGITVGEGGNIYLVGKVDGDEFGDNDLLVLKYSPAGEVLWAKRWRKPETGDRTDIGNAIAYDGSALYIGGWATSYSANNDSDALLLKMSTAGAELWARTWGVSDTGTEDEEANAIAVSSNGDIFLGGRYNDWIATQEMHLFILKYDSDGVPQWQKQWDNDHICRCYDVAADGSGNAFFGGAWEGGSDGDMRHAEVIFLKLDGAGTEVWQRSWYDPSSPLGYADFISGLEFGASGELYIGATTSNAYNWIDLDVEITNATGLAQDIAGELVDAVGTVVAYGDGTLGTPNAEDLDFDKDYSGGMTVCWFDLAHENDW